jgi:hypothetical protein
MVVKTVLHSIALLVSALTRKGKPDLLVACVACIAVTFVLSTMIFVVLVKIGREREKSLRGWNKMVSMKLRGQDLAILRKRFRIDRSSIMCRTTQSVGKAKRVLDETASEPTGVHGRVDHQVVRRS